LLSACTRGIGISLATSSPSRYRIAHVRRSCPSLPQPGYRHLRMILRCSLTSFRVVYYDYCSWFY
jgi:hypothetical protein